MGKHKCFISYHHKDENEVQSFVKQYEDVHDAFISKIITDDNIINSDDDVYIMKKIRERYLSDSTVTIVMFGKCTWSRKFVDWEIASTLRDDPVNKISGLMGIYLPSTNQLKDKYLPKRFKDNYNSGFAKIYNYPQHVWDLTDWIEDAYQARYNRSDRISKPFDKLFREDKFCI